MKLKGKESRSIRCSKKKKEPIKVVYISNPIKVTASAAEFRALVQQLTGQDAADDLPPDLHPTRFPESTTGTHDDDNNNDFMFNPAPNSPSTATPQKNIGVAEIISSREQPQKSNSNAQYHVHYDDDDDHEQQQQQQQLQLYDVDGLFVPEMIDNFGLN
ncbi:hypothetical protein M0R45_000998 [Rubus argutus]|uniref:VQ domain-containing protein n=1 Tax=Rubus argutus TaxID=59490 RepID=A0AAW1VJ65_RUBAR